MPGPGNVLAPTRNILVNGKAPSEFFKACRPFPYDLPIQLITNAYPQGLKTRQHVQFRYRQAVKPVEPRGIRYRHQVEPAASSFAAGSRPEFLAFLLYVVPVFIMEFGNERPAPYSGGISLYYSNYVVKFPRPHPGAGAGSTGDGV